MDIRELFNVWYMWSVISKFLCYDIKYNNYGWNFIDNKVNKKKNEKKISEYKRKKIDKLIRNIIIGYYSAWHLRKRSDRSCVVPVRLSSHPILIRLPPPSPCFPILTFSCEKRMRAHIATHTIEKQHCKVFYAHIHHSYVLFFDTHEWKRVRGEWREEKK